MEVEGFEPSKACLRSRCLPVRPHSRILVLREEEDSNLRGRRVWEPSALAPRRLRPLGHLPHRTASSILRSTRLLLPGVACGRSDSPERARRASRRAPAKRPGASPLSPSGLRPIATGSTRTSGPLTVDRAGGRPFPTLSGAFRELRLQLMRAPQPHRARVSQSIAGVRPGRATRSGARSGRRRRPTDPRALKDGEGFEPSAPSSGAPVFGTGAFNRAPPTIRQVVRLALLAHDRGARIRTWIGLLNREATYPLAHTPKPGRRTPFPRRAPSRPGLP